MGTCLTLAVISVSLLYVAPTTAAEAPIKERRLVTAGGLTAGVVDHPEWCQSEVEVAVRASTVAPFRGNRLELQRMLGQVRGALQIECPKAITIRITGLVEDVFVYDGIASKNSNWILTEIPALLTQQSRTSSASSPSSTSIGSAAPHSPIPPTSSSSANEARSSVSSVTTMDEVRQCDMLAAHPDDPEKPPEIKGVPDDDIQFADAATHCQNAARMTPDDPRLKFQLARAYLGQQKNEEAIDLLLEAAEAGHGGATAYLGDIALYGAGGLDSDPEAAKTLYLRAAEFGFKPAATLASEIVAGAVPAAGQAQAKQDYKYESYIKDMIKGDAPKSSKSYGVMMHYVINAMTGVKYECPNDIPDKNWAEIVTNALFRKVGFLEAISLNELYNQGEFDELIQDAMDDGYAVATNYGCGATETKNIITAALKHLGAA
jgi:tetratricopeptide (TPR) repeat protein